MAKAVTSQQIRDRFLELLESNDLNMSDELQIFEAISKKYCLQTVSDYARGHGISYNGVQDMITRNRVMNFRICGIKFVC